MSAKKQSTKVKPLTSEKMLFAWEDFHLSRQAQRATPATLEFYRHTALRFCHWLESQGVESPADVTARHVRGYLAELSERGLSEWTVNGHARAVKTLVRFWYDEQYTPKPVKFAMPPIHKKRLPVLTAEQIETVLQSCDTREKAIILLMVDSGLRRAEVCQLNWGDIDASTGLTNVERGKGGKYRIVAVGANTRRALLKYRRTLKNANDNAPVIQTIGGQRFATEGISQLFDRLSKRIGFHVAPHMLRRSFAMLSYKAGADIVSIQTQLGHSSVDMTRHYIQELTGDDILESHNQHSPVDNLKRLKK